MLSIRACIRETYRNRVPTNDTVLTVRNLKTAFRIGKDEALAVEDVSFQIDAGETLAIVGESGSGKSVTALSVMGLIPDPPGRVVGGEILYRGRDLLKCSASEMRAIRIHDISMIFQEPMTSLNPVFRIGTQISEVYRLHQGMGKRDARDASIEMLERVGIPAPEKRIDEYPHQLSGGMRQRVMIAIALACDPALLIADEPTTALDVTIQAQILNLLQDMQAEFSMAMLLITHDLGVVAEMADRVSVMYAGRIIHSADAHTLFESPQHPYTLGLFRSLPHTEQRQEILPTIEGYVPPIDDFPNGCRFHPRCPYAFDKCQTDAPPMIQTSAGDYAACWLHDAAVMQARGSEPGIPEVAAS